MANIQPNASHSQKQSPERCSVSKGVLRNCSPQACNFIKKKTLAQVFSCESCEISKNSFFTEHFWATASLKLMNPISIMLFNMLTDLWIRLPYSI